MLTLQTIINTLIMTFSLSTATSLLLHDTNVDKATITALTASYNNSSSTPTKPGNDPHTHSERSSLYQAIRDIHASQPRIQPQRQGDKRYVLGKPSTRGHHPFDNSTLPIVG